jgi:hypothetical protein
MPRSTKFTEPEFAGKEEMVQAIVDILERTFATSDRPAGIARAADFFRGLDERTLRAIAYRQGVFEGDLEPSDEDRERE